MSQFLLEFAWNVTLLREYVSSNMANFIINEVRLGGTEEINRPWWIIASDGMFLVKITFELLRKKRGKVDWARRIWLKGLPYKISFILWRLFKRRVPTNNVLKLIGNPIASRYICCNMGVEETTYHLFLTTSIVQKLRRYFVTCAGIKADGRNILNTLGQWLDHTAELRVNGIFNAIPAIIIWELWTRRNAIKYGRNTTYWQLLRNCTKSIHLLIRIFFTNWSRFPENWIFYLFLWLCSSQLINGLQSYKPNIHVRLVAWQPPQLG